LLWEKSTSAANPKGGCGPRSKIRHNPDGVEPHRCWEPRVASRVAGQPWAGGHNPFGIAEPPASPTSGFDFPIGIRAKYFPRFRSHFASLVSDTGETLF